MTLASGVKKLFALAALLRIHHWIKNCLVAIPLFFSGRFFHLRELAGAAGAFLAFSAMSSAVYIFNDIRDIAGKISCRTVL